MPLLPGERLNKRYRIVSLLAEGAYGAVYRAWDTVAEVDVAVKEVLDPSVAMQKRFRAEARRLSRWKHPRLAAVLDHFALEDGGQYLISEFVDGVDLQQILAQYGALPTDLIVRWLQAACEPLTYLHGQEQLHLNLKPANVRITPAGEVKVVNAGLVGLGLPARTDGYTAPEQAAGGETAVATDIYGLGATLYTLLTGQAPPDSLRRESGLVELKPAREVNPDVAPYLSIVATRAMSLRPDTRYESASEFARALDRPIGRPAPKSTSLRRTPSSQTPPLPQPRTAVSPSGRRMEPRTVWALSVLLLILIVAGVLFTLLNLDRPEVSEAQATATLESAVVSALTALAPTPSPLPVPTVPPTPTPEPLLTEIGSRMLFMPGGIVRIGNDEGERNEQPAHLVRIDPFFIDETEVTNGQYQLCVEAGVCDTPQYSPGANYHPAYYGDPAYADYPVAFVDWYDAETFCVWREARLPSEAEWEMAAGFDPEQGLKLQYPWGDAFDGTQVNFCDSSCPQDDKDPTVNDGHLDTAPVGSFGNGRSPIGLFDMAGNVAEWVGDWYDSRFYFESPDTNPRGPVEGSAKVIRGGSWLSTADEVAVTRRDSRDPNVARAQIGFRCAIDAP